MPVGKPYRRPLLPHERQLIELAGCTVEEYQRFIDEAIKRAQVRPAGYEHIPDVQATGIELILINLAVGIALSAVSYLLTPKPAAPSESKTGQRTLASRTGADRFAQTTGFDSSAELAQYGDAVPIIWTKWTGTTGGVLVSPKLVWSRMFSLGGQQGIKLLYVVGESGVGAPDLAGIYLGNNGLDVISRNSFALWWNDKGKVSRSNLLYGTQGGQAAGDPQDTTDLFFTPAGVESFSQALTPSNSTQFGVSNGTPNGTQYRLNYRIVSIPEDADGKGALLRDRAKICGRLANSSDSKDYPQDGVGIGYFRRQGIFGFSSKTAFNATVGMKIQYIISGNEIDDYFWGGRQSKVGGGKMDDVNNTLDSECAATDDMLQLGETVIINASVWRVINRSIPVWRRKNTQLITLECIEVLDLADVRVLADRFLISPAGNSPGLPSLLDPEVNAGSVYDNLARISFATIKNTRPCDFTQIGIKSQVWGRFNGLCNFNSLYSRQHIKELDNENVSVQSGTMSEYFPRASVFTLYYREIGQTVWVRTSLNFCVRGSSPVDQFHSIGVRHGVRRALEFRIVPLTAAHVYRLGSSAQLWQLNSNLPNVELGGNGITIRVQAEVTTVGECAQLETMKTKDNDGPERNFDVAVGIAEISNYGGLITRSCDNGPEHQVVFLNEQLATNPVPTFESLSTVGFAARSGRNLSSIDQLRLWIGSGINNSNSFPELVLYLLQRVNGISNQLIDTSSFTKAAAYCANRGLLFDGAISERINLRQYIADTAPFFLLNFVIANGKFSLMPALPDGLPNISNLFTAGNIIENSFSVEYLAADQRRDFQALVTYRTHLKKNELPVLRTYRARFEDVPSSAPIESFDMSAYCTSRRHAEQVARYFLSIRRRITHAIKFKTAHEGAGIAPGSYIKVALEQNVISSYGNGVISATDGRVTSATPLADGTYAITYYKAGADDVQTGSLTIANGITADTQLWGALFTQTSSSISASTYLVEQIELDEDGLVSVTATEFPAAAINSDMAGTGIVAEET